MIGWRDVPVDNSVLGESVKADEPMIRQFFISADRRHARTRTPSSGNCYVIRKQAHHALWDKTPRLGKTSTSSRCRQRTIVYKGMVLAGTQSLEVLSRFSGRATLRRRWRCSTSVFRRIPSRPGDWRSRSASFATMAKSIRSAATSTG